MAGELMQWRETTGIDHTGYALHPIERLIAGRPYEIAGGEVRQNRSVHRIEAYVWVMPGQQAGMQATNAWVQITTTESLETAKQWCEHTLITRLTQALHQQADLSPDAGVGVAPH